MSDRSTEEAAIQLGTRLRAKKAEIEAAALERTAGIASARRILDPEYIEGFRAAGAAAVDYGLEAIEIDDGQDPQVPAAILSQARLAARRGVGLDTVLRRYFAGFAVFSDFLLQELEAIEPSQGALERLVRLPRQPFDRLIEKVSLEYARERERSVQPPERRRAEQVRRLLEGDSPRGGDLAYDFDGWHIGFVAVGNEGREAIRALGRATDRRSLVVSAADGVIWGWLGGRQRQPIEELIGQAAIEWPQDLHGAIGEPERELAGWRRTHRQAMKAFPLRHRSHPTPFVLYREVALLSAVVGDELLAPFLQQLYLAPLADERQGDSVLLETLRAYFAAELNVSSAAADLCVKRHTVTNRLRTIEARIGQPIWECMAELAVALQVED